MNSFNRFVVAASLALAVACATPRRTPPIDVPPPPPSPQTLAVHLFKTDPAEDHKVPFAKVTVEGCDTAACSAEATAEGDAFLSLMPGDYTVCGSFTGREQVCARATVPGSVNLVLPAIIPPTSKVRVDGRFWVNDQGTFRPIFASDLAPLPLTPEAQDAKLDETQALGFNGVRVFAGALPWAGQTVEMARQALPRFLEAAGRRGLYVYVVALTESGYDVEAHLRAITGIVAQYPNTLLEVANEIGHPTQSDIGKDEKRLLELARRVIPAGVVWSLGSVGDEPGPDGTYRADGGLFNTGHLDRGRDPWNQVRRLREIAGISEATKKPAMSGEPIGSAEVDRGGARMHNPPFYFAMGMLCRGFEIGCVFHSEDGLHGRILGPNQKEDAEAFIAGWKSIPTTNRLVFMNARWAGSPVVEANFDKVVRTYSFLDGPRGWIALVGLTGDPALQLREGWRIVGTVAERPGIRLIEISR